MNRYFAKEINENGEIICLHDFTAKSFPADRSFVEITEEEYNAIMEEWAANVPEVDPDEISDSEALAIILGVSE